MSVVDVIKHYQRSIEKYSEDEKRVLHCINKLNNLPVKVNHLQETGVGRTVNSLRKFEGNVGVAARTLIAKWKEMVAAESSNDEGVDDNSDGDLMEIEEQNEERTDEIDESKDYKGERYEDDDDDDQIKTKSSSHRENASQRSDVSDSETNHREKRRAHDHAKHKRHSEEKDEHRKYKKKSHSKKHGHSSSKKHRNSEEEKTSKSSDTDSRSNKEHRRKNDENIDEKSKKKTDKYESTSSKYGEKYDSRETNSKHNTKKIDQHDTSSDEIIDEKSRKRTDKYESTSSSSKYDNRIETNSKHTKKSDQHDISSDEIVDEKSRKRSDKYESRSSSSKYDNRIETNSKHNTKRGDQHDISKSEESKYNSSSKKEKNCDKTTKTSDAKTYNKQEESEHRSKSSRHKHSRKSSSKDSKSSKEVEKPDSKTRRELKNDDRKDSSSKKHDLEKRKLVDMDSFVDNNHSSDEEGINSFSGTSFAEALGMISPVKKKLKANNSSSPKLTTKVTPPVPHSSSSTQETKPDLLSSDIKLPQLNLDITLPVITPNYQPLPSSETLWSLNRNNKRTEEETLDYVITSKKERTKVYSGNKAFYGYVPSLFELCIRILQDNIDALAYTGGVPYSILLPVLERATPEQLYVLEHHNAYLLEDTDVLWEQHCNKEFRGKRRNELESWREAYSRFLLEREEKLKALTANIKQSIDKSQPVRQTKLAYVDSVVKPPRGVARKQAKYGTGNISNSKPLVTPASRVASLTNSSTITVPNPGSRAVSHSSGSISKPKKAPLMQKTLALIKSTNRYRR